MEIKVIGSNCSNGIKLTKVLKRALDDADSLESFEELNDENSKKKYGIKNVPGLVINGEVISEGKVPTVREIYKLLIVE
ncbi:MAG: thioredoxin family protein [Bacilli bacterium]|nr:thioredoxin family protein [Bacilli bacterium]MBQ8871351.1 thioredoxin family protein [Bacilli bacterium]